MNCKVKKEKTRNANLARLSADDYSVPSEEQHDFCLTNYDHFRDPVILNAANVVMCGYMCQESVHRNFIRIVNALIGRFETFNL